MDNKVGVDAIRARADRTAAFYDGSVPDSEEERIYEQTINDLCKDIRLLLSDNDLLRVELEEEKRLRMELKQIALDGFSDLSGCSDVFIEEKRRLQQELATARETIEQGGLLLEAAREEIAKLGILAERAYPELKESGFCSRHGGPGFTDYPVDCRVCFPDLRALITQHIKVGVERVATARSTALSEAIEKVETEVVDAKPEDGDYGYYCTFNRGIAAAVAALEQLKQESGHANK